MLSPPLGKRGHSLHNQAEFGSALSTVGLLGYFSITWLGRMFSPPLGWAEVAPSILLKSFTLPDCTLLVIFALTDQEPLCPCPSSDKTVALGPCLGVYSCLQLSSVATETRSLAHDMNPIEICLPPVRGGGYQRCWVIEPWPWAGGRLDRAQRPKSR